MQSLLETFLAGGVFAFILTFARIGTALMIMPGLGDSFVSERIRLHMALGLSFVLFPLIMPHVPTPVPPLYILVTMMVQEMIIGLLIGTVSRIFMTALDTAGMVISTQSGLANAQVFNPSLASQGSIIGALLSVTGVVVLFSLNLHHMLITALVESYNFFPMGEMPDSGSMAEMIALAVSKAFEVGIRLSMPFIVLTMLLYVGMGVLARLMPQVQVFMVALPLQILMALTLLALAMVALIYHWSEAYYDALLYFFSRME